MPPETYSGFRAYVEQTDLSVPLDPELFMRLFNGTLIFIRPKITLFVQAMKTWERSPLMLVTGTFEPPIDGTLLDSIKNDLTAILGNVNGQMQENRKIRGEIRFH